MAHVTYPKPTPSKRKHPDAALDTRESAKVRKRSGGQCEVREVLELGGWLGPAGMPVRCQRAATQVHHMIGGNGKRGRGISALAIHKQHMCDACHLWITGDLGGKKLKRIGGDVPLWTDTYQRVNR
jgi:hypothetical protein